MALHFVISAVVAVTVALSALTLAAAIRRGARSEESLGVRAPVDRQRERNGPY